MADVISGGIAGSLGGERDSGEKRERGERELEGRMEREIVGRRERVRGRRER